MALVTLKPPEIQKSKTTMVKLDSPDMVTLRLRSYVSGTNYTCAVCSQAFTSVEAFRKHAMEMHAASNKEPRTGKI